MLFTRQCIVRKYYGKLEEMPGRVSGWPDAWKVFPYERLGMFNFDQKRGGV